MGQAPNICVFKCFIIKASSACEHFKLSHVVLCCGPRCHLQLVKLRTCCMCSVWISESLFDIFQEGLQSLYLQCPVYNCHGFVCCPNLHCSSTHERECI